MATRKKKKIVRNARKNIAKRSFLSRNYSLGWEYIKDSRNFVYVSIGIFSLFVLAGAFLPTPENVEKEIIKIISELLLKTEGMSQRELVSFIFFNNLQSSFTGMLYGIALGIFPVLSLLINGYLLGFVAMKSVEIEGFFSLWRILPHGIFELPALFLSLGLGIKLGSFIFRREKIESLKNYLLNSFRVFVLIILPLLLVASIIEGSLIFLGS